MGTQEFEGVARARAMHQTSGLIKIVADAGSRRILGAHIIGPDAGNLIHELVLGMVLEATVEDVARTLHIHPTLSEGLNAAAGAVHRPAG